MVRGSKQQHASFAKGGRFFINSSRKSYVYNAWFCIELSNFLFSLDCKFNLIEVKEYCLCPLL